MVVVDGMGERECRDLLASQRFGRLAVVREGRPQVFLVSYTLDLSGAVVFEADRPQGLAGVSNHHVTFEVDHVEPDGAGWCVVVQGVVHQTSATSLRFAPGAKRPLRDAYLMRIHTTKLAGRRLTAEGASPAKGSAASASSLLSPA